MKIQTSKEEIVAYWFARVHEWELSVDEAEAHERCWRCGCQLPLERCHIVPDSLGGKDEASNLVLLCKRCHIDNPNIKDPEIMWDWIRSYKVPFYDTFWSTLGMREYAFIYGKSIQEELRDLELEGVEGIEVKVKTLLDELMDETSYHFGHPYLNTATIAGMYRVLLKRLAQQLGKEFPLPPPESSNKMPWWL